MKAVFCLVLVLSIVSISLAAIRAGNYRYEENPDQCTMSDDYVLNPGRHKDERIECGLIFCYNDGTVELYTCTAQDINMPGYQYGGFVDKTRNYPACCERYVVPIPKPTLKTTVKPKSKPKQFKKSKNKNIKKS